MGPPFHRWGSVIWERQSRHAGLDVTVVARRDRGRPPFLAYLHTPDRAYVRAVSEGRSPEAAADRVDDLFATARTYTVEARHDGQRSASTEFRTLG